MALKPTDYQIKKGTLPVEFQRGVEINGKASVLTVTLRLNHKKGLHTVFPRLNHDQITGNPEDDAATLEVLTELTTEAIAYAIAWRKEWNETQRDKSQGSLFPEEEEDPDEIFQGEPATPERRKSK